MAELQESDLLCAFVPHERAPSEYSLPLISLRIKTDGFESWKIHLFDFVDEIRRTKDVRLLLLPPVKGLDSKLEALIASTTLELCREQHWSPPSWALENKFLFQPWFPSQMESLKASAVLELSSRDEMLERTMGLFRQR